MRKILPGFILALYFFMVTPYIFAEACSTSGSKQYKPDGACNTVERICCQKNNEWSAYGGSCPACDCTPGQEESSTCPAGQTGSNKRTCSSSCTWGAWGGCVAKTPCESTCANGYKRTSYQYKEDGPCCEALPLPTVKVYNCQPELDSNHGFWIGVESSFSVQSSLKVSLRIYQRYDISGNVYGPSYVEGERPLTITIPAGTTYVASVYHIIPPPMPYGGSYDSMTNCSATLASVSY